MTQQAPTLGVLHISDLHISTASAVRVGERLAAVVERVAGDGLPVDYVLLTGDVVQTGAAAEYTAALDLLIDFIGRLQLPSKRLLVVPGNHDVDRTRITRVVERGIKSIVSSLEGAAEAWNDGSTRSQALDRQTAFFQFAEAASFPCHPFVEETKGTLVGWALLNSSWCCSSDKDKGQLFLSEPQVTEALRAVSDAAVRIAAFHHPVSWLHEHEQTPVMVQLSRDVDLICVGHRHTLESKREEWPSGSTYVSVAKAIDAKDIPTGFTHLAIGLDDRHMAARHYMYVQSRRVFVPDTELSDDGVHTTTLSRSPTTTQVSMVRRTTIGLAQSFKDELDRSIRRLAPTLARAGETPILTPTLCHEQGDTPCRLEDILAAPETGWLVSADRMAGKTTFLRLLARRFAIQERLAVLVSFLSIEPGRDAKATALHILRTGLNCSTNRAKEYLRNSPVFLVDDVDLTDGHRLDALAAVRSGSSDVGIVCCARTSLLRGLVESPLSAHPDMLSWNRLVIRPSSLRHIRALVDHLCGAGLPALHQRLRDLVDASFQTELPRAPWVVLAFLETCASGFAPSVASLNTLLERYVELRLRIEGSDPSEYGEYALRALLLISAEMSARSATTLPSADAIRLLRDDYERSGVASSPESVLRGLEQCGLLVQDDKVVAFAFPVFQDFFHAKWLLTTGSLRPAELTLPQLVQFGGALSFWAGFSVSEPLLEKVFALADSARVNAATTVDLGRLDAVGSLEAGGELGEKAVREVEETPPDIDALDRPMGALEQSQKGRRARQLSLREVPPVVRFIESLTRAVSVMKSSTFVGLECKVAAIQSAVTLTASLINVLLDFGDEVRLAVIEQLPEQYRKPAHGVIAGVMVVVGNVMVTGVGAGSQLEKALVMAFDKEDDPFRRLTILTWISIVDAGTFASKVSDYLARRPPYPHLVIAYLWTYFIYVFQASLEGKADPHLAAALREMARAIGFANSTVKNVIARTNAAQAFADDVMRKAELETQKQAARTAAET